MKKRIRIGKRGGWEKKTEHEKPRGWQKSRGKKNKEKKKCGVWGCANGSDVTGYSMQSYTTSFCSSPFSLFPLCRAFPSLTGSFPSSLPRNPQTVLYSVIPTGGVLTPRFHIYVRVYNPAGIFWMQSTHYARCIYFIYLSCTPHASRAQVQKYTERNRERFVLSYISRWVYMGVRFTCSCISIYALKNACVYGHRPFYPFSRAWRMSERRVRLK